MKIIQNLFKKSSGWKSPLSNKGCEAAQLVLLFGSTEIIKDCHQFKEIQHGFPQAVIAGCSTAGEILSTEVHDDTLALTAVEFKNTKVKSAWTSVTGLKESFKAGQELAGSIPLEGLAHVFVLSDGLNVNGSDLVRGLAEKLPAHVMISGGLAGDGSNFKETYICLQSEARRNMVAIIGFYGHDLKVGCASLGGWDPFGPQRKVTKSEKNVLYELDGNSALSLYKEYLGEQAAGLPSTGLLFPLTIISEENTKGVVRTILGVDEKEQSMIFAGDIPQGSHAQLMKANFDRLIDGAIGAANNSIKTIGQRGELAILISCVGRKLILKQRVEEEIEGVRDVLGDKVLLTGFYSYGEISPFTPGAKCELHNQTMTITVFSES
jgi:hypothetical protein